MLDGYGKNKNTENSWERWNEIRINKVWQQWKDYIPFFKILGLNEDRLQRLGGIIYMAL